MPVTDATEGLEFNAPIRTKVGPKCTISEPNSGHWYCIEHNLTFPNNLTMQSHTAAGDHTLVWICHTHGPEVP